MCTLITCHLCVFNVVFVCAMPQVILNWVGGQLGHDQVERHAGGQDGDQEQGQVLHVYNLISVDI